MFDPKYQITSKILNNLSKISEIRAIVMRARLLPARENFMRRAAIIKMAHTSTSIEGNTLDEYQVAQILEGKDPTAQDSQVLEVRNYLKGLRLIDKLSDAKKSLNKKDILEIHKTVVGGLVEPQKTGVFRKGPVYLVNLHKEGREELAYMPPLSAKVPGLIDDLLLWLAEKKDEHPIIAAGLLHYQFETIHPFTDGNGRVGRLLTLLHLYQSDWGFRKSLVLEDYYNRDRKRYYLSLQTGKNYQGREGKDLTPWLEYFTKGFLEEAERIKDQVQILETVGGANAVQRTLGSDEVKIIDFVVSLGKITSADVVDILRVPKRTAQSKLKKLEENRLLVKKGSGPATAYLLRK